MSLEEKLCLYTKKEDGCLIWTGPYRRGIPIVCVRSVKVPVRKVYFEMTVGEVNEDRLCVVNTCGNPCCVHPKHLSCESINQYASKHLKHERINKPCKKCGASHETFKINQNGARYCVICNRKRAIKNKRKRNKITQQIH